MAGDLIPPPSPAGRPAPDAAARAQIPPPPERFMIWKPIRSKRSRTPSSASARSSGSSIRSLRSTAAGPIARKPTISAAREVACRTSPVTPVVFWP